MPLSLSSIDYQNLVEVAHSTHDARQMHRAKRCYGSMKATPWTRWPRLFVTPRTVFRWRRRFYERQTLTLPARLADGPRSGRPKTVHGIIDTLISEVIDSDPRHLGYHATVWTAPLLRQYLRDVHHLQASRRSVGLAIARLGIAWKRPRYDLARRDPPGGRRKARKRASQAAGVR